MHYRILLLILAALMPPLPSPSAAAQDEPAQEATEQPAVGPSYSNPVTTRWKIGATIKGGSQPAGNVLMTIPIPNRWPEQSVTLIADDIPTEFGDVTQRELESGVRQMVVKFPKINAQQELNISVTLEVRTSQVDQPNVVDGLVQPKSSHREGKPYLGVGPYTNHRNSKMRNQVRDLIADEQSPWKQVELIYDWVRDNIETVDGELQDAVMTLQERSGSNESKVFLFVTMCRSAKFPARIVFAQGTHYAEFMLTDEKQKEAFWFPCNVNGIREFGSYAEPRIILQKGDNIRVPEKQDRQKFVAEFLTCQGKSRPVVKFFRELLPNTD